MVVTAMLGIQVVNVGGCWGNKRHILGSTITVTPFIKLESSMPLCNVIRSKVINLREFHALNHWSLCKEIFSASRFIIRQQHLSASSNSRPSFSIMSATVATSSAPIQVLFRGIRMTTRIQVPRALKSSSRPHRFLAVSRPFAHTTRFKYPRKDSQDKDSINTEATEYSKSATDDEGARQHDAAFNPNVTDPQEQKDMAGKNKEVYSQSPIATRHLTPTCYCSLDGSYLTMIKHRNAH